LYKKWQKVKKKVIIRGIEKPHGGPEKVKNKAGRQK
jgi:hypothetical protein